MGPAVQFPDFLHPWMVIERLKEFLNEIKKSSSKDLRVLSRNKNKVETMRKPLKSHRKSLWKIDFYQVLSYSNKISIYIQYLENSPFFFDNFSVSAGVKRKIPPPDSIVVEFSMFLFACEHTLRGVARSGRRDYLPHTPRGRIAKMRK